MFRAGIESGVGYRIWAFSDGIKGKSDCNSIRHSFHHRIFLKAAGASVEMITGLQEYFANINHATDHASRTVNEEYQIIAHVKEHFNQIQEEIETLVATSEENSATIQNITETISAQNNAIHNISTEIEQISSLSLNLEQNFKK